MKFIKNLFLVVIILNILFIYNYINFAEENKTLKFQFNGRIIDVFNFQLDNTSNDELVVIYKDIFENSIAISIDKFENGIIKNIFTYYLKDKFFFFFDANIESKYYKNIVLGGEDGFYYIDLKKKRLVKFLDKTSIYTRSYREDFPYIPLSFDLEGDGYSELVIPESSVIEVYKRKNKVYKKYVSIKYKIYSLYNFQLAVGGFNTVNTIFMELPDIKFFDLNKDGYKDIVLIYRDRIIYYLFDKVKKYYNKNILSFEDLIEIRSGYSPINKHIMLFDYDGDGYIDVLFFKFNMSTMFNINKEGTMVYLFKGRANGKWNKNFDKQFFISDVSGIETKFYFFDVNGDGRKDLINVGSKLLSTNFILNLTIKRSFSGQINIYLQKPDNTLDEKSMATLTKAVSLDQKSVTDSSKVDFSILSDVNLNIIISRILTNITTDLNNDGIVDFLIYGFDGSFSLYLSNKKYSSLFKKKPDKILHITPELSQIFYLSGPYNLIIKEKTSGIYFLIVINKNDGIIYVKEI